MIQPTVECNTLDPKKKSPVGGFFREYRDLPSKVSKSFV